MICRFYDSTVGKKVLMALTGVVLIGFVVGHMAGNLKALAGFDPAGIAWLDQYALHLRRMGEEFFGYGTVLWLMRGVLLGALLLHILLALQLTKLNQGTRQQGYAVQKNNSSTLASRTMAIGGSILMFFIYFHILHFTTGHVNLSGFVEGHVYANVYGAFQSGPIVSLYVIAMCALGLHLYHGTWSVFQTFGIESSGWNCTLRLVAKVLAIVVCIGFITVPVSFYLGMLPPPTNQFTSHAE